MSILVGHHPKSKLLAFVCAMVLLLLQSNAFSGTLKLNQGRWLLVTKAVDGPSNYDLDYLAAVVASTALTDGQPSVLAVNDTNSLVNEAWHNDYIRRYKYSRALVVGQTITTIPGVFPVTNLDSATAGVEQAKSIAQTVWKSSTGAVVCSANDYSNALVASSLAARLRVPLLFSAEPGDLDVVFRSLAVKSVLVVGAPVSLTNSVTSKNLAGAAEVIRWLQAKCYPVNYVAAVNPTDRNAEKWDNKLSMASVLLAARRGGVIYPITNAATYITVGAELKQLYAAVGTNYYPEYLLLGGNCTFIPFGQVTGLAGDDPDWGVLMTDTHYSNMDADTFMEIAVGRLVANNFSEASLIASRISTYDALKDGNWEKRMAEMGDWGAWAYLPMLQNSGFALDDLKGTMYNNAPPLEYGMILHGAHSSWQQLGGAFQAPNGITTLLAPAFVMSLGCSTVQLDQPGWQISKDLLRQGAVGFMGGTRSVAGTAEQIASDVVNSITDCGSLGHALRRGFQGLSVNVLDTGAFDSNIMRYNWILIGDPALVLHVPTRPATRPADQKISSDGQTMTINSPDSWVIRPFPKVMLTEWGWSDTLHVVTGAGVSMVSANPGIPGYHQLNPHFIAKYRTAGKISNITQQDDMAAPLGWSGSFGNHVHVDEHSDGTRTYLWRVRLMDSDQKNGGSINRAITKVSYSISCSKSGLGNGNRAPVWKANTVFKLNGQHLFPFDGSLGADARDPDGDPLTFAKTGGAAWLKVDLNGALSGQPNSKGVSTATVTVSDGVNPPVPVKLQISVAPTPPQEEPHLRREIR